MNEKIQSEKNHKHSRRKALKNIGFGIGAGVFFTPLLKGCNHSEIEPTGSHSALIDPIYFSSATSIANAIRNKILSSEEVTKAFLKRIEEVNPKINAVVQTVFDEALASAKKADQTLAQGGALGPLHGVPITIKDSFDTVGIISTAGTLGRANFIPDQDASIVARLKKAGVVLLGKTNTPELTLSANTNNLVYGQTNNPYNLNHIPGGSSGGAAAIISSGGSSFDIGTDTGGSIRFPAYCCGICGIKPTNGRVPRTGHIVSWKGYYQSLTTVGPLARYVEDLITILPVISGSDGIDPYIYDIPLGNPHTVDLSALKFAYYTNNGIMQPTAGINAMILQVVDTIANIGAAVREARAPVIEETLNLFFGIVGADGNHSISKLLQEAGTTKSAPYLNWVDLDNSLYEKASITPKNFVKIFEDWDVFRSRMLSFYQQYDIIICPVASEPALNLNFNEDDLSTKLLSYTATYNLTGWPGAVVRIGTSQAGLPIGVQIIGKPWQEHQVLAVARFLENKFGGFSPPVI